MSTLIGGTTTSSWFPFLVNIRLASETEGDAPRRASSISLSGVFFTLDGLDVDCDIPASSTFVFGDETTGDVPDESRRVF